MTCGAVVILYPGDEDLDVTCDRPDEHEGRHREAGMGSWDDDDGVESFEWE